MFHFFFDQSDYLSTIRAFEHHHHATHHFPFAILGGSPVAHGTSILYTGYIAYQDGNAVLVLDDNFLDVCQGIDHPHAPNKISVGLFINVRSTGIFIVAPQGIKDLYHGSVHAAQFIGLYGYLVLFEHTPQRVHLRHSFGANQLGFDDPVLDRAQVHGIVLLFKTFFGKNDVLINLPQTRADRGHFGYPQTGWDIVLRFLEALGYLGTCPIDVDFLFKYNRHYAQTKATDGTQLQHFRNGLNRLFDGVGDELLHFLRSQGGRRSDDLYLIIGDVRQGIDGQSG